MPIGETYSSVTFTNDNFDWRNIHEQSASPSLPALARPAALAAVALGSSFGVLPHARAVEAAENPLKIATLQELQAKTVGSTVLGRREKIRQEQRCDAQKERDELQYSSCEYEGAYAAITKKYPKWTASHRLSPPGDEDKTDRKKAFFKTHPKAYETYQFDVQMSKRYMGTVPWVRQCYKWADEANVPLSDDAIKLLDRESDCNPSSINPSSGAGGIPQALPFSKTGCEIGPRGAVCQIKWFYGYTNNSPYGSYSEALAHSYSFGWY